LFDWNDSDEEIAEARAIAAELGVDQLLFHLTQVPEKGRSARRAPGTPGFELIRNECSKAYRYDFNAAEPGASGLFAPEKDQALGVFSWMGRTARFEFPRGLAAVQLDAAVHGPEAVFRTLRLKVNLPWLADGRAEFGLSEWVHNLYPVPSNYRASHFPMMVEASQIWRPVDLGFNRDGRELGAIVRVRKVLSSTL
jgi:hypothetical protein